jgi:phosphoenolpyruvate carboxykinase (ATP)
VALVKQEVTRVEIPEMAAIIRGIVKDTMEWRTEPHFGTRVPKKVNGVDMAKFDLSKFYSKGQIDAYVDELKRERIAWLGQFKDLNPAILDAIKGG